MYLVYCQWVVVFDFISSSLTVYKKIISSTVHLPIVIVMNRLNFFDVQGWGVDTDWKKVHYLLLLTQITVLRRDGTVR